MTRYTGFPPAVREQLMSRSGGACEKCGGATATQAHHRRPRGMGSTRRVSTNQASNGLMLCEPCHRWIETAARRLSTEQGFLVPQHREPADVMVRYRGRMAWLTNDGEVVPCEHLTTMHLFDNAYGDYEQCADCDAQLNTNGGSL